MPLEKNKTDIVFIYPPAVRQKNWEYHLGVNYIQAYLKEHGFSSLQYIPTENHTLPSMVEELTQIDTQVYGLTCYDSNFYYVKLLASYIKQIKNEVWIVVGGPTATFSDDVILNNIPAVDVCVRGEGEKPVLALLEKLSRSQLHILPNISYRDRYRLKRNKGLPLIENIDHYPSPYLRGIPVEKNNRLVILTSRGCVYNCVYCNCSVMYNKKIRYHSIERVIAELEYLNEIFKGQQTIPRILIGDDAFTINKSRVKKICREIINKNFELKFFCETRADRLDDELIDLMKKAGFDQIDFGLESAVPQILRQAKKVFYQEQDKQYVSENVFLQNIKESVSKCEKSGIRTMVNIIIGLPGDTRETAQKTLDFVKELAVPRYSHNWLRVYSGTEIFSNLEQYGFKIESSPFGLPYDIKYPFPVEEFQPQKNSINRFEIRNLINETKFFLEGASDKRNPNFRLMLILDYAQTEPLEHLVQNFLIETLNLNQRVFVEILESKRDIKEFRSYLAKNNIPSQNFIFLLTEGTKKVGFTHLEPFNQFYLNELQDSEHLHGTSHFFNHSWIFKLTYQLQSTPFLLEAKKKINPYLSPFVISVNKCQFCQETCPATLNQVRIFIKPGAKRFSFCLSEGKSFALSELPNWQNILQKRKNELRKQRNCDQCVLAKKCAKCLFPYPLTITDYCKIQKEKQLDFSDESFIEHYLTFYDKSEQARQILEYLLKNSSQQLEHWDFINIKCLIDHYKASEEHKKCLLKFINYKNMGIWNEQ